MVVVVHGGGGMKEVTPLEEEEFQDKW